MYIHGDLAWLGFETTMRDHRGRGAQGALLRHRVNDSTKLGAKCLTVATGAPAEGESPDAPNGAC
jgi:hypothetical protein